MTELWCEKHDHLKRTCPWCDNETLQERLDRIAAIVDVIEQHGDLDLTTITQLRLALTWEPQQEANGR
jgi:hypothetical protein